MFYDSSKLSASRPICHAAVVGGRHSDHERPCIHHCALCNDQRRPGNRHQAREAAGSRRRKVGDFSGHHRPDSSDVGVLITITVSTTITITCLSQYKSEVTLLLLLFVMTHPTLVWLQDPAVSMEGSEARAGWQPAPEIRKCKPQHSSRNKLGGRRRQRQCRR